jgi:hypothetical protein
MPWLRASSTADCHAASAARARRVGCAKLFYLNL